MYLEASSVTLFLDVYSQLQARSTALASVQVVTKGATLNLGSLPLSINLRLPDIAHTVQNQL